MHHKCTKFHCSQSKSCWDMWGCISCRHHSNAADARYFFSLCLWNTGQTWKDEWLNKSLKNEPYLIQSANELDSQSLTSFLPRCLWCSSFSFLSSSYSRTRFFVALTLPSPRLFFFFYTIAIFVPSTLPHSLSLLLFRLWASSHNSHCNSSDVKEANQAGFSPVSFTMIVFDQFVSRLVMIVVSFVTGGSHWARTD